ncbi:hypothetical protein V6N11_073473 [Hibiscus sabdariffa]|uniref:Uncharacterized protein n=2 Tax=Hibiscus sabdariffa TaxID=183260 RepID=A0ABR2NTM1_9ROSI
MKRSFCLIICCSLLASVLFFTYGTVSRNLLGVQVDGNGGSKAVVTRSSSTKAPSKAGDNSPPTSSGTITGRTLYRNQAAVNCRGGLPYRACMPPVNRNKACSLYNSSGCN